MPAYLCNGETVDGRGLLQGCVLSSKGTPLSGCHWAWGHARLAAFVMLLRQVSLQVAHAKCQSNAQTFVPEKVPPPIVNCRKRFRHAELPSIGQRTRSPGCICHAASTSTAAGNTCTFSGAQYERDKHLHDISDHPTGGCSRCSARHNSQQPDGVQRAPTAPAVFTRERHLMPCSFRALCWRDGHGCIGVPFTKYLTPGQWC